MTDFPASPAVPGQAESMTAYAKLNEDGKKWPWWDDYLAIKEKFPHFKNWRIWVYLAWEGQPREGRKPTTVTELAEDVLGCTDRSVRNWKVKDWNGEPGVDEAIAWVQASPLLKNRADVFAALSRVARMPSPKAHQDRKLFLEMTGDYVRNRPDESADDGAADDWWSAADE
ncbi:MAG: hypothetical protein AAF485_05750 [Chloroflexota bacterium]